MRDLFTELGLANANYDDIVQRYQQRQKVNVDPGGPKPPAPGLAAPLPPAAPTPGGGIMDALRGGFQSTGRMLGAAVDTYQGDEQEIMDAVRVPVEQTYDQRLFRDALDRRKQDDPEGAGLWEGVKNVGGAIGERPLGALHEMVAQLPNTGAVLGAAGAGALAGSALGPLGTIAGGIAGMAAGNIGLETGGIALDQANRNELDLPLARQQGAIKGGVITGVDTATIGINRMLMGAPGKAAARFLADRGVDPTNPAIMRAAFQENPGLRDAAIKAFSDAIPKGAERYARLGAGFGLETTGEGIGEYFGSKAAGLEADITDAVLESVLSMPQSAIETGVAAYLGRGDRDAQRFADSLPAQPPLGLPAPQPGAGQPAGGATGQPQAAPPSPLQQLADRLRGKTDAMRREMGFRAAERQQPSVAGGFDQAEQAAAAQREADLDRMAGEADSPLQTLIDHLAGRAGATINRPDDEGPSGGAPEGEPKPAPLGDARPRNTAMEDAMRGAARENPPAEIRPKSGNPFKSEASALNNAKMRKLEGYEPVQVEGGWVLRRQADAPAPREDAILLSPRQDQPGPIFRTQLEKLIGERVSDKGANSQALAQQIDGWARKGEIKPEELQYVPIQKFLAENPGRVSKQQLLDFVEQSKPQLGEVVMTEGGGGGSEVLRQRWVDDMATAYTVEYDEAEGGYVVKDNYGEIAVGRYGSSGTLNPTVFRSEEGGRQGLQEYLLEEAENRSDSDLALDLEAVTPPTKYDTYKQPGGENYKELLITKTGGVKEGLDYTSGHWDERNVLAHVRFDERRGANGEKVLFLEEIQSDWHQEGRKKGYKGPPRKIGTDHLEVRESATGWVIWNKNLPDPDNAFELRHEGTYPTREAAEARVEVLGSQVDDYQPGVPDAPFKKTWPMLAMKRMIRYAADNGFDRIAWATGEQNANLYTSTMRQQVDSIYGGKREDGGWDLMIEPKGGSTIQRTALSDKDLAEFIGKDNADRLIAQGGGMLEGDDLKIGGEGMIGFYDQILPAEVNKYAKRYGVKVEMAPVTGLGSTGGDNGYRYIDTPEGGAVIVDGEGYTVEQVDSVEEARDRLAELNGATRNTNAAHSFQVTDQMRDDALAGQPLFSPRQDGNPTSLENAFKLANSKQLPNNRAMKVELQALAKQHLQALGLDGSDYNQELEAHLIETAYNDAIYALRENQNAIGWYDKNVGDAMAILQLIHPEIGTDPTADMAFKWALAVTSNGLKVDKNFQLAEKAYEYYKREGRMPTDIGVGQAAAGINSGLETFNRMVADMGPDALRKFMSSRLTVKEITSILEGVKIDGEYADAVVMGSAILGPKIGNGFYSNLNGVFDQLTIDRWLMRTWGRWTGTLITERPDMVDAKRAELSRYIDRLSPKARGELSDLIGVSLEHDKGQAWDPARLDEIAAAVKSASMTPAARRVMNRTKVGESVRKTGNALWKYLDGQKEAPLSVDRPFIRQVLGAALERLREKHPGLTMADLQALLWYPEKRLYDASKSKDDAKNAEGYNDEEAPNYANAAASLARAKGVSNQEIKDATRNRTGTARPGERGGQGQGQPGGTGANPERETRTFVRQSILARIRRATRVRRGNDRARNEAPSGTYQGRSYSGTAGLWGLVTRRFSPEVKSKNLLGVARASAPKYLQLNDSPEAATYFRNRIQAAKDSLGGAGAAVDVYDTYEIPGIRLFLSENEMAGFAIKPDGDLVSVFNHAENTERGVVPSILMLATEQGARKLDAFDTVLPDFYSEYGFEVVARTKWGDEWAPAGWDKTDPRIAQFNNGEPDVVFMVFNPNAERVYAPGDGQVAASYDEAVELQNAALDQIPRFSPRQGQGGTAAQNQGQQSNETVRAQKVARLNRDTGFPPGTLRPATVRDAAFRQFMEQLGRLLGRDIVPIWNASIDRRFQFNGVYNPADPETLFIDIDGNSPALATLGHEFVHSLRRLNPKDFARVANQILRAAGITKRDAEQYADWVNDRRGNLDKLPPEGILEELVADIFGEAINDRGFWQRLEKRDAGLAKQLAAAIRDFVGRLISGLKGAPQLEGSKYVKDMESVRDIVAEFLGDYAGDRGVFEGVGGDPLMSGRADNRRSEVETADLYSGYESTTSQVREPRRPAKRSKRAQDFDAPADVPAAAAQARDNFLLGYKSVPVGQVKSGVERVTSPAEAAHVLAPFRKYGQEHVAVLVLDDQGKPTQIIQHTVGAIDGSAVFPGTLAGAIAADPNAASVWLGHNHPSGRPNPSDADRRITGVITDMMDGTGITVNGHVILAANNGEAYYLDQYGGNEQPVSIKPLARRRTVPITERKIRRNPPKDRPQVTSPDAARELVERVTSDDAIVLLDNQHNLVGTLTLTADEMGALRDNGQVRRILAAIDKTNAAAAVIKASDRQGATNVARFLNAGKKVMRVLDAFTPGPDGLVSSALNGQRIESAEGPFLMPRQTQGQAQGQNRTGTQAQGQTPTFEAPDEISFLDKVRTKLYEKFTTLLNAQRAIGPVSEDKDVQLALTTYPGRVRARIDAFERNHVDPLKKAITESGLGFDEIGRYLHARHAPSANARLRARNPGRPNNDRLSGMSDAEAAQVMAQYQNNLAMRRIVRMIDDIQARRMALMVREELLTQDEANAWAGAWQHYVPLNREESGSVLPKRGQGFDVRGKESKTRAGSADRPVDHENMVARILTQYEFAVQRAEKNKVAQTLYNMAKANPNDKFWLVDEVPSDPFLRADGTVNWRDNYMHRNVIAAKFNGETKYVTFDDANESAAQAISALKNLDVNSAKLLAPLLFANRVLAALNTSLSPEFVISNFFRDWQTAGYNLTDTELKDMKAKVLKGTPAAIKGIRNALRGSNNTAMAAMFERFRQAGGITGWMQSYDQIGDRLKALQWDMKSDRMHGLKQLKAVFRAIEDYNTMIENGVRLSAFKAAVESGMSDAKAARVAKELTVNFNRRGEWGVTMNALYLFYNASIQGSVRMLRAIVKRDNKMLHRMLGATVAFAMVTEILNHLIDGDDDEYENVPDQVKDRNLVLMDPFGFAEAGYFKIPLPWGYNLFHILGQEIGKAAMAVAGERPDYSPFASASRLLMQSAQAFNPIQDGSVIQTLAPTLVDPAVRIAENKDWHGGRLYPDYNDKQANYLKAFATARETSKDISKWLYEATLDPETMSATIDVSPEWLDMIFDFATGSAGRVLADSTGFVKSVVSGNGAPELKEIPLARKLYQSVSDSDRQRAFYEKYQEMLVVRQALSDAGDAQEKREILERLGERRKLIGLTRLTQSQMNKISRALKVARRNGDEALIKRLEERRMAVMDRFGKRYYAVIYGEE